MKALIVILIFGIVFLALFANSNNSNNDFKSLHIEKKINFQKIKEQSFFATDPSSQLRNQIEIMQEQIRIPEPKHL